MDTAAAIALAMVTGQYAILLLGPFVIGAILSSQHFGWRSRESAVSFVVMAALCWVFVGDRFVATSPLGIAVGLGVLLIAWFLGYLVGGRLAVPRRTTT